MDMFLHNYEWLITYANAIIYKKNLQLDAGDLVNDAYIEFFKSGKEYNRNEFKKIISRIGNKESETSHLRLALNTPKKIYTSHDQKCCKKCHVIKPANAFYMSSNKKYVENVCKSCRNKIRSELSKKNGRIRYPYKPKELPLALELDNNRKRGKGGRPRKYNGDAKERNNACFKRYVANNREKWNSYCREWRKKKKAA